MEHITLYFRQGSSDKVYQARIESKGDGFIVAFAYGRRGAALTSALSPVSDVGSPRPPRALCRDAALGGGT